MIRVTTNRDDEEGETCQKLAVYDKMRSHKADAGPRQRTETSDTSETVDSHAGGHEHGGVISGGLQGRAREGRGSEASGRAKAKNGNSELHFGCVWSMIRRYQDYGNFQHQIYKNPEYKS